MIAQRGISVLLFPEGGRSAEVLQEFKEGAAYIAIKAGAPAVPIAVLGLRRLLPMGSAHIRSGRAVLRIGDPIPTNGLQLSGRAQLNQRLYDQIAHMLRDSDS